MQARSRPVTTCPRWCRIPLMCCFFFKQKTAYEITRLLEFRRVLFRSVTVTNPQKVLFPEAGYTKLDVVRYYIAVADGALRGSGGRPNVLARFVDGIGAEFFYQKDRKSVGKGKRVDFGGRSIIKKKDTT